jgi:omega-6 fatty acid desaturase (delta-12 desaturase)
MKKASWIRAVTTHQEPMLRRSLWQVVNTLVPYLCLWGLMYWSLDVSYWLTLALAVVVAGFMLRIFIIFHDCGHGSFFKSQRANNLLGFVTGVLTFTPYSQWRYQHALHHATSGDLDGRGTGDIWTLTVQEYVAAPRWKKIAYRMFRNPLVLFVLAPFYLFLIHQRFPSPVVGRREHLGVHLTNGALLAIAVLVSLTVGIKAYLLMQLPVLAIAGSMGLWLFYVQHQFEGVYWRRRAEWGFTEAALMGSSFYALPRILQWFSGNIGFHHVHHLSPRVPNYNLERCHRAVPLFDSVKPITLLSSLRSFTFRLWDEQNGRLIGYRGLRRLRRQRPRPCPIDDPANPGATGT